MRHTSDIQNFLGMGQKLFFGAKYFAIIGRELRNGYQDCKILEGIAQRIRGHDFARGHTVDLPGFLELCC
jgi:hypothetical protein